MLSSAVNLSLAVLASWSGSQLDASEVSALKRIEPTIVRVMSGTRSVGAGVLIDSNGYFLAHRSVSVSPVLFGRLNTGETIQLSVASIDEVTQLALLHAEGWKPVGRSKATVQANSSPVVQKASASNATRVLLVLPEATVRGELTQSNLVGVMKPSQRGLTLSELRFEDPGGSFGGGLVFTLDGRLVGVLGATLGSFEMSQRDSVSRVQAGASFGAGGGGIAELMPSAKRNYGPSAMTIGYTVTPDILERVIAGFCSPSREVGHPALGLMCRDAQGGGALVDRLVPGSPAQVAGIRPGDVILEVAGQRILNQIDYTRVLVRQRVGDTVAVRIRRVGEELTFSLKVGK